MSRAGAAGFSAGDLHPHGCERFPEYDHWLTKGKAEKEEHRKRVEELEGDPTGMLLVRPRKADRQEGGRRTQYQLVELRCLAVALPHQPERKQKVGEERSVPMRKRQEVQEMLRSALALIPPGLTSMR